MQATLITLGEELLSGQTVNTNLAHIARGLKDIGFVTKRAVTIGDSEPMLHTELKRLDTPLLVLTGGLGPTRDDLTKESVCRFFDKPLVLHHESLSRMRNYFAKLNREMAESNTKQAYFPADAIVLPNRFGTAPGAIFDADDRVIVLLPGPPSEMKPMFTQVLEYLQGRFQPEQLYEAGYLIVGVGESDMETMLQPFYAEHPHVEVASYANLAEIRYVFKSADAKALETAMDAFRALANPYIVGPHDKTLEERVFETLMHQEKTISFAESCTAGLAAGRLVNVPDVSKVFKESYILYDNAAKMKQLGVHHTLIDRFGAVSDACVYELAYHLAQRTDCDVALSISGIAGPSGGTAVKPVGTVYFGVYHEGKTKTTHKVFSGDRQMIRHKAVVHGLYLVLKALMHEDTD